MRFVVLAYACHWMRILHYMLRQTITQLQMVRMNDIPGHHLLECASHLIDQSAFAQVPKAPSSQVICTIYVFNEHIS